MTDHSTPPAMLTPIARRMPAASMVQTANSAVDGLLVADALDATAASILRVSGVDDTTARTILSSLWTEPTPPPLPGLAT